MTDKGKKLKCGHSFCKTCYKEFFRCMILDQNRHYDLVCPEKNCGLKPTHLEVYSIVDFSTRIFYYRKQR